MLRKMTYQDVHQTVAVHLVSFKGFFLSLLGARFLSLFYAGICRSPEGIAYVYLNEQGKLSGFVAGTSNPRGFYSRLLKRQWFKFAMAAFLPVLRKPSILNRVARAIFYPSRNPFGDDVAGLFSIGVLPELQGTGAGKFLVNAFLDEARDRGCKRVFLTTDRDDNELVNHFYKKLGFVVEREYTTPEGRNMNEYWITL